MYNDKCDRAHMFLRLAEDYCRQLMERKDSSHPPKKYQAPSTMFLCWVSILGCSSPRKLYQPEDCLSGEICALKQYQFLKGEDKGQRKEEGRQGRSREPRNSIDSGMGISTHG